MKFLSTPFLLLFLSILVSSNVQSQEKDKKPLKPCSLIPTVNLICDSLFNVYTYRWANWWKNSVRSNPINPYFTFSYKDTITTIPDSIELFYALTPHWCKHKPSQLTALAFPKKHQCRFNKDTARWRKWLEPRLKGSTKNIPVGVKIHYPDLLDLYNLSQCPSVVSINGYFGFHNSSDVNLNRMIVIFRPVYKDVTVRKKDSDITCDGKSQDGTSSINIDFTNPCPPCNNSQ
jgi:hypothetical protein